MSNLRRHEDGQIGILMVMILPVIFLIFALALDAGVWFLDHRLAQNQVDAAALAAVQRLPVINTAQATETAEKWLVKNGSGQRIYATRMRMAPSPNTSTAVHPHQTAASIRYVSVSGANRQQCSPPWAAFLSSM